MQIVAKWSAPIALKKKNATSLGFELDLDSIPAEPGVYIFCRRFGKKVAPIYIGQSAKIKERVKGHLKSLPLMQAIEDSPNGPRFFIFCTVSTSSHERAIKQIKIIEKALIMHSQTEGHVLFNLKGTKLPTDEIQFSGNQTSQAIAPRLMLVKKALTKSPKKK